jgi:hypothetical protein
MATVERNSSANEPLEDSSGLRAARKQTPRLKIALDAVGRIMKGSSRSAAQLRSEVVKTPHWRAEPQFRPDPIEVEEWDKPDGFLEGTAGYGAALAELEIAPQESQWAFWTVGAHRPGLIQAWGVENSVAIYRLYQNALWRATEAAQQADEREETDQWGRLLKETWEEAYAEDAAFYEGELRAIANVYGFEFELDNDGQP